MNTESDTKVVKIRILKNKEIEFDAIISGLSNNWIREDYKKRKIQYLNILEELMACLPIFIDINPLEEIEQFSDEDQKIEIKDFVEANDHKVYNVDVFIKVISNFFKYYSTAYADLKRVKQSTIIAINDIVFRFFDGDDSLYKKKVLTGYIAYKYGIITFEKQLEIDPTNDELEEKVDYAINSKHDSLITADLDVFIQMLMLFMG